MSKHLKTIIIKRLSSTIATFVELPAGTRHARGVRYFRANTLIKMLWGAMDMEKEGRKYKKRIVVRPSRFRDGLFELYTYHFPTHWSSACVANRELIKEAQRRAHILEHDYSTAGLEWRIRFFEEGLKPYSRFYQYTYVSIYRQLQKEAAAKAEETSIPTPEDVSFEPLIDPFPLRRLRPVSRPLQRLSSPVITYAGPPGHIHMPDKISSEICICQKKVVSLQAVSQVISC